MAATILSMTQAEAATFHPSASTINASGQGNVQINGAAYQCAISFSGTTSSNGMSLTIGSAAFTGSSLCTGTKASNLPWQAAPLSNGVMQFQGVALAAPFGSCGPNAFTATVSNAGVISLNSIKFTGNCSISAALQTSPPLTVN